MKSIRIFLLLTLNCLPLQVAVSQALPPEIQTGIGDYLTGYSRKEISAGKIRIDSVAVEGKTLLLFAGINCSYIPFREENTEEIYKGVRALLPREYASHKLQIITDRHAIEELIPLALRTKRDKRLKTFSHKAGNPLITRLSVPYTPKYGLQNRHIALWQSHGYYYEPKLTRWEWQRARIFQTVEDLYTQSFVLPYLVPMLENAGANVLMPRERDTQTAEIVIDNDGCRNNSCYTERTGDKRWHTGEGDGFAHLRDRYIHFENPFREGSYRVTETIRKGKESYAEWIPEIPSEGYYAVYVSYKTVSNSTDDALYTVHHKGGTSRFSVNQQMGSGTWIYLGHFRFGEGRSDANKIVLSNKSSKAGRVVTADAIKIGGGYGNIARRIAEDGTATENIRSSDVVTPVEAKQLSQADYPYETSGYPRFTEAARYWMQWAGIPDSIYSESKGKNDYTDDYKSRGSWVNYLAGGSAVHPNGSGLNIPVDMAFAFHSDAGTTLNDSIIGTLGIFYTNVYDEVYANGTSRYAARDLTDLIQSYIVNDIRALYEPNWSRRGMWNQSYYEARVPRVPTMLLELLSHQNFADMRYGIDPRFRFTVSRSIYKGMLRFICSQYGQEYIVQPLPVDHISLQFIDENEVELTWQPVDDPLEPTAKAKKYIVYTRIGDNGFDNGVAVSSNSYRAAQAPGLIYSYKVTALNDGGESFPSEILSAARAFNEKGTVLVINGFDRISAPDDFVAGDIAGFSDATDHGVPYKEDISYIGSMKEFRRSVPWMDDDASGFGDSHANYETMVIAGNTFDYPAIHGSSILKAGYSFVSCSNEAIEKKAVDLNGYKFVDLILGKQRQTKTGRGGVVPLTFKTFGKEMQEAISAYCQSGGNIFVSGAFVGSDLWDNPEAGKEDKNFATDILKYKWRVRQAAVTGNVKSVASPYKAFSGNYQYYHELNPDGYVVESPDGIVPADEKAYTVFRYSENNISAGVAYKGAYKTCVLGFPFEAIRRANERDELMKAVLTFFNE
ncbi:MAG: xanthan lyase [Mediterranea sp.]|jgi:hypothetical protein|nr:xanthan lyase [Mediterranea sp.]